MKVKKCDLAKMLGISRSTLYSQLNLYKANKSSIYNEVFDIYFNVTKEYDDIKKVTDKFYHETTFKEIPKKIIGKSVNINKLYVDVLELVLDIYNKQDVTLDDSVLRLTKIFGIIE